ncbi:MAG: cytochrome-c oxidase, cbb3-type subunit III [Gammaproteobacteria bacterium]|nr:cytochrome-c oxidase, cbb3-type subunit III [Gammaproteobacteria bacterium]
MSSFWHWYVVLLTLLNIFACFWLVRWATRKRSGEAAEGNVTGHSWDGLQEYNNPLPRWWLWLFYITIIFALIYIALYPTLGNWAGAYGWTSTGQYQEEMQEADAKYGPIFANLAKQDVATLSQDSTAGQIGQRLFLNYCATCHGSDAGGAVGFPNLADKDWLYGGTPEAIKTSIMNGRVGAMPPWGAALGEQGVDEVAAYVMSLSGRDVDAAKASAGKGKYNMMCIACHSADGSGNTALGAPNLADNVWLYGGSPGAIKASIRDGRNGVMPAHKEFLGEDKVHVLAAYIYSLQDK